ncbi:UNVERIFIED_CONTAM: LEAF RUST 10 DISEASE-RESISTANCE LOCUS RECEPTOR-LIKE PROTEIN KINASE-like 1.1 [Sesamum indicum]
MSKGYMHGFLESLGLSILGLILSCRISCGAHYQYEACVPTDCGNGLSISFPFYVPDRQESYCGYPGFVLNCSKDGFPVLNLPGNDYIVENISYRNRSLHVWNAAVLRSDGSSCLPSIRNTSLDVAQFDYVNVTGLHLFSISEDGKNWDVALYDKDENLRKALETCDQNVVAPVEGFYMNEGNDGMVNLREVLRRGFALNWIASDCNTCEDSGGRCGFNATTFHFRCFCPDRPHSRSCKPDMGLTKNLFLFFLLHLVFLLHSADSKCQKSFPCGNFTLQFPYFRMEPDCGLLMVDECESENPKIQLGGIWYDFLEWISENKILIRDPIRQAHLSDECLFLRVGDLFLPKSPSISFSVTPNLTLFICDDQPDNEQVRNHFRDYYNKSCGVFTAYYRNPGSGVPSRIPQGCRLSHLPMNPNKNSSELLEMLTAEFTVEWNISESCNECHHGGGQCLTNTLNGFECKKALSGVGFFLVVCVLVTYIIWQRKKIISRGYLLSRNLSSDPSSKSDIEGGSLYFGIPIFSCAELEEATNNFDSSKELGDGGFGTVYYGKLRDGREVAIKRLYEHNYRRVQQFMNEIKILTSLRHPNLVSLYGCTSRRSRELLLVYEYIPNGTVGDHLHGDRAKEAPLTWPVRMSIAIETASALAYLHKSDIIHRDVKSNNILLDSNFCVKVADFGLSRLFPNDVTHISTAPQGTPGYVDPEYHQCYQLTDKSDVYSFGVVLIELISSMPAVDISRHRHEINLANLAVNRIQRCAFDELIDPSLGYETDAEVMRMTTSVAELAFRCLQLEKDMRPSMDEVLSFLQDIQAGEDGKFEETEMDNHSSTVTRKIPPSPETEDVVLLKNKAFQSSPNTVTDVWASSSSTATSSIG